MISVNNGVSGFKGNCWKTIKGNFVIITYDSTVTSSVPIFHRDVSRTTENNFNFNFKNQIQSVKSVFKINYNIKFKKQHRSKKFKKSVEIC